MLEPANSEARHITTAASLGLVSFGLLLWVAVKPSLAGVNPDAAVYLLLADWLSPWRATDIDFGPQLFAHYSFPPLYPLILAALGGGSGVPTIDYTINAFAQAVAVAATYCWARRIGCGQPAAVLSALSLAITPIALFTAMGIFSEPLYLAVSMTGLAVICGPQISSRAWHAAALLFGLAAVTRSVGLFAVFALLLTWVWRTRARGARWVPLLALAPSVLWLLVKASNGWQGGYVSTVFAGGVARVALALLAQLPTNLHALTYHFVRCFDSLNNQHSAVMLAILVLPATLCFVQRLRAGWADAWYAALYLLVLMLWPYPNHFARFLLVLLPLFCAYSCLGVALLLARCGVYRLRAFSGAVTASLLVLVLLPSFVQVLHHINGASTAQAREYTRISSWYGHDSLSEARVSTAFSLRVLKTMASIAAQLPRDGCVSSTMAEMFMLHGRRWSRPPPPQHADLDSLRAALAACPYVLLLGASTALSADFPRYYPAARVANELSTLLVVPLDDRQSKNTPQAILARYEGLRKTSGEARRQ